MKHRHVRVKIYGKTPGHPYYRIAYRADGNRVIRSFATYGEAKSEADRVAKQIAKGNEAAAALSLADALACKFATRKLAQLCTDLNAAKPDAATADVVITLEDAITEYAEAKRAFGSGRLIEAVKGFLSTVARVRRVRVRQAVDEYIADRQRLTIPREPGKRPALSPKLCYQDELRLDRFTKVFDMDVCDLTKDAIDLFFREHLGGLSPKSRNHYRGTLRQWLNFCVNRDYLARDHRLAEAPGLSNETADGGDIEIYTPAELALLLTHAEGVVRLLIAIGGLAGLRTAELLRLDWQDLWRRPGYIEVGKGKAKTRQRRLVPIRQALESWLAPWRCSTEGRIWVFKENEFHVRFRELCAKAGVERKDNALRHGYISYALAETRNENQVAQDAGTSPNMLHRHYRQLATPAEAEAWFNVFPPATAAG